MCLLVDWATLDSSGLSQARTTGPAQRALRASVHSHPVKAELGAAAARTGAHEAGPRFLPHGGGGNWRGRPSVPAALANDTQGQPRLGPGADGSSVTAAHGPRRAQSQWFLRARKCAFNFLGKQGQLVPTVPGTPH